jgi:hypothetical protein
MAAPLSVSGSNGKRNSLGQETLQACLHRKICASCSSHTELCICRSPEAFLQPKQQPHPRVSCQQPQVLLLWMLRARCCTCSVASTRTDRTLQALVHEYATSTCRALKLHFTRVLGMTLSLAPTAKLPHSPCAGIHLPLSPATGSLLAHYLRTTMLPLLNVSAVCKPAQASGSLDKIPHIHLHACAAGIFVSADEAEISTYLTARVRADRHRSIPRSCTARVRSTTSGPK